MAVVRFLFYFLLCIILFVAILVAIVGGLYVLNTEIYELTEIDIAKRILERMNRKHENL